MITADPFNLTIPRPAAHPEATTSPTPSPHSATPPPRHSATSFLHTLLSTNFDFAHLAKTLSPEDFLALTTDPTVREQLSNILAFTNTCLTLRQAQARAVAIAELTTLLSTTDDPIEKRRAATALLRATDPNRGSPSGVARRSPTGASSSDADPNDSTPPLPQPTATPAPHLTVSDVLTHIRRALANNDTPEPDTGLATIAAFCTPDATIDNEPIYPDDEPDSPHALDAAIDTLADSSLTHCLPPRVLCKIYEPNLSSDGLSAQASFLFGDQHRDSRPYTLTVHLRRVPLTEFADDDASVWRVARLAVSNSDPP